MALYSGIMSVRLTIDKAGRVVIPKPVRDRLRLGPGDALDLNSTGEALTLRPVRQKLPLQKERGIWVYRSGAAAPVPAIEDLIAAIREERAQDIVR